MEFWLKMTAISLWSVFACLIGCVRMIFQWKNTKVFVDTVHLLAWGVLKIVGLRLKIENEHILGSISPVIYVGNHQSAMDVAVYGEMCPANCVPVGKKEILYIPIIGQFFWGTGAVLIDRSNRKKSVNKLNEVVERIRREKLSIGIMPEGTRNKEASGGLLPFKKGAFHLAVQGQVPIIPLVVAPMGHLVSYKNRRLRSGTITVRFLDPVHTEGMGDKDIAPLLESTREKMLAVMDELSMQGVRPADPAPQESGS